MNIAALVSGGVDSSVVVHRLKELGFAPTIFYIRIGMEQEDGFIDCPSEEDIEITTYIAKKYGCKFEIVPLHREYWDNVVKYTIDTVKRGLTPNPDMMCNKLIKFGAFEEKYGKDFDLIATGHYARVCQLDNGRYTLGRAKGGEKDQTYALYSLTQEQLAHTLMPVGAYDKGRIREIAQELGLRVADKPDSQDICFVPDGDYASYIREYTGRESIPGNFVLTDGTVVGQHKGIIHYTVGQRKGLGLSMGMPVFVLEIRPETNEIVVGPAESALTRTVRADQVNFMAIPDLTAPRRVWAKIRYNHRGAWCTVEKTGEDEILCTFEEPQRAVTPGQAVVLYEDDCVLGGGTIRGNDKTR